MRKGLLFSVLLLLMFTACKEKTYHSQLKLLYKNSVPLIRANSLARKLAREESMLLLDTRSRTEWEVSHLAGATLLEYDAFHADSLKEVSRQRPVAVYCTIGYRSEKIGEKLKDAGFKEVYNLFGGIIEWKNRGFTVVDAAEKPSEEVHTFNNYWGIYLTNRKQIHEK